MKPCMFLHSGRCFPNHTSYPRREYFSVTALRTSNLKNVLICWMPHVLLQLTTLFLLLLFSVHVFKFWITLTLAKIILVAAEGEKYNDYTWWPWRNLSKKEWCTHINLLKPTCYVMHQQFNIHQLYVLPTLYLCVLYLSENKQRLVPLIA